MGIVHLAARRAGHATQRQVLDGSAKTIAGMAFYVGKVDQEGGILDHAGHFPAADVLVGMLVFIKIFLVRPGCG